jgi:hypothetical protein
MSSCYDADVASAMFRVPIGDIRRVWVSVYRLQGKGNMGRCNWRESGVGGWVE